MSRHRPTRKVTAATLGAAVASIIVTLITEFTGADLPVGVEGAIAVLVTFVAGYLTKEGWTDEPRDPHRQAP